jgi:predicted nucleic acid-binding protein
VITVTADTNIYISGLMFGGLQRQFLDLARRRRRLFQLVISPVLLEELQGVLRDKFWWSDAMLENESARVCPVSFRR